VVIKKAANLVKKRRKASGTCVISIHGFQSDGDVICPEKFKKLLLGI